MNDETPIEQPIITEIIKAEKTIKNVTRGLSLNISNAISRLEQEDKQIETLQEALKYIENDDNNPADGFSETVIRYMINNSEAKHDFTIDNDADKAKALENIANVQEKLTDILAATELKTLEKMGEVLVDTRETDFHDPSYKPLKDIVTQYFTEIENIQNKLPTIIDRINEHHASKSNLQLSKSEQKEITNTAQEIVNAGDYHDPDKVQNTIQKAIRQDTIEKKKAEIDIAS